MSEHVSATTVRSFDADVIEASARQPVLVDFWADWCQPCRMLAPILEKLAVEYAGRAKVTKVNTDVERELAQAQGVRSLPTVRLFRHGRPVEEIIGVQPEAAFRSIVERHLERPSDRDRAEAARLLAADRAPEAVLLLERVIRDEPDNEHAQVELVEALTLAGQVEAAQERFAALPVHAMDAPRIKAIEARVFLARSIAGQPPEEELAGRVAAAPDDLAAACALAARQFLAGHAEPALERWLEVLRRGRDFGDGLARKSLLHAFELLQDRPELVQRYRRQMMALLH